MNYDIIKFLNLEGIDLDIDYLQVVKQNNIFFCYLKLNKPNNVFCYSCGSINTKVHSYYEKTIKHGIYLDNQLFIKYKARRFLCKDCGISFFENNPFLDKYETISFYTKIKVLDSLRDFHSTFTSVALAYHISISQVTNIFDSYVDCSRKPLPLAICIDEFYLSRKSKNKYACLFLDFFNSTIIDVYHSRHKFDLIRYFDKIPLNERLNVHYVCIDMYDTYKSVCSLKLPNALIAVDSFHVIKHLNEALIKIRISVMSKYNKSSSSLLSNDMYYYMLKKFHYFFVKDYSKIYNGLIAVPKIRSKWRKEEILKYLLSIDSTLTSAYYLKEEYRELNMTADHNQFYKEKLRDIILKFTNFSEKEFRDIGKMLSRWEVEIFNSFIRIDNKRLSNGPIEGANSRIKTIMKNACGYSSFRRLRNKIIFSLNKDEAIQYKVK